MNVLIIDCYDSFTYNLYQQVGTLGADPVVLKNDAPREMLDAIEYDRIILSPGPGRPEDSGLCLDAIRGPGRDIPTLGVCLGHQAICIAFGGDVEQADHLMHGKTSEVLHDGKGIYTGISTPFIATRYHSLVARESTMPDALTITATSRDDGYVMGIRHREYPIEGIQFHPESILTTHGQEIIRNFLFGDERRVFA